MFLQRWLRESYSKLYAEFGRSLFTAAEAANVLSFTEPKLNVAFSKLHGAGALIIFARSRPRSYRLLDPRSLALLESGVIEEARFPQEEYVQLIYDVLRAVRGRLGLVSFCVYGSLARGEAKPTSDLDVLLVSDDFQGSLASRLDFLSFVDGETADEVRFLKLKGRRTMVSFMPFRKEEAEADPILFVDLAVNAKILTDEGGFLKHLLIKLRARLDLAGARRVEVENGWYWDLKPDYRPGLEELVI